MAVSNWGSLAIKCAVVWKLPLPLGEGWGEGIAVSDRTSYPHPTLSQGRGGCLDGGRFHLAEIRADACLEIDRSECSMISASALATIAPSARPRSPATCSGRDIPKPTISG